jgi:type I restriction enzyme S subunit
MGGQDMKKKEGFKETKLGWIPEDWEVKKISEIGKVITGGTPSTSVGEYWGNEHLWYTPTDISNFSKYAGFSKRTISSFGLKKSSATLFPKGTLMVCTRATIGEIAIATSESCTNQGFKNLIVNEKNELEFIYYLLIYSKKRLIRLSSGSTFLELGTNDFREVGLFTPKLPEQKAIADCLSTWDTAITKQNALIKAKQQLKKALMQQLLSSKKRLSGFSGEWEEKRIDELFDEIKDKNDGGEHEPLSISAGKGFRSQREKFDRVIAGTSLSKYIQLKKGDFSYNKGNSKSYKMGCIYLLETYDTALVPFVFISFRPTKKVDSHFYKHFFIDHGLDRQLKMIISSGARGDGLLNVSKKDFFKLKLPFPCREEQTAIANVLNTIDQEIILLTNQRNQLQLQKKGLMQQLLTGKKRLKI